MYVWKGGGIPYGYSYNSDLNLLEVNKQEKTVFKKIISLAQKGLGATQIAEKLNQQNLKSRTGTLWSNAVIGYLISPSRLVFYAGYTEEEERGNWEPLIDKKLASQVGLLRDRGKAGMKVSDREKYLLSNLDILKCGYCGSSVKSSITKAKKRISRYYLCTQRQTKGTSQCVDSSLHRQEKIDDLVLTELKVQISKDLSALFDDYVDQEQLQLLTTIREYSKANLKTNDLDEVKDNIDIMIKALNSFEKLEFTCSGKRIPTDIKGQRKAIKKFYKSIRVFSDHILLTFNCPIDNDFNFSKRIYYEAS